MSIININRLDRVDPTRNPEDNLNGICYLDGKARVNGDGSQNSPFKDFETCIKYVQSMAKIGVNCEIRVMGECNIGLFSETYDGMGAIITRAEGYHGPMLSVGRKPPKTITDWDRIGIIWGLTSVYDGPGIGWHAIGSLLIGTVVHIVTRCDTDYDPAFFEIEYGEGTAWIIGSYCAPLEPDQTIIRREICEIIPGTYVFNNVEDDVVGEDGQPAVGTKPLIGVYAVSVARYLRPSDNKEYAIVYDMHRSTIGFLPVDQVVSWNVSNEIIQVPITISYVIIKNSQVFQHGTLSDTSYGVTSDTGGFPAGVLIRPTYIVKTENSKVYYAITYNASTFVLFVDERDLVIVDQLSYVITNKHVVINTEFWESTKRNDDTDLYMKYAQFYTEPDESCGTGRTLEITKDDTTVSRTAYPTLAKYTDPKSGNVWYLVRYYETSMNTSSDIAWLKADKLDIF